MRVLVILLNVENARLDAIVDALQAALLRRAVVVLLLVTN